MMVITIGEAARRLGFETWQVRQVFIRGLLPPAQRVGVYRVIAEADLPKVEASLKECGYLPQTPCQGEGTESITKG